MSGKRERENPARRLVAAGFVVALVAALAPIAWSPPAQAATFVVSTTADAEEGSLRAAIEAANANGFVDGEIDEITFNIPGAGPHVIELMTPLPPIGTPTRLLGYSEPDSSVEMRIPSVRLTAPDGSQGLRVESSGVVIEGLAIEAGTEAVAVFGGGEVLLQGVELRGNWLGTVDGETATGIGDIGVALENTIETVIEQNVISGSRIAGVTLVNARSPLIQANDIGLTADGTDVLPNGRGIVSDGFSGIADNVVIRDNYIAGSVGLISPIEGTGIFLNQVDGGGNLIENNTFGLTRSEPEAPAGNSGDAITILDPLPFAQVWIRDNTITNSGRNGVSVGPDDDDTDTTFVPVGIVGNSIYGNDALGISVENTTTPRPNLHDSNTSGAVNWPEVELVDVGDGLHRIDWTFEAAGPDGLEFFDLDFYANRECDASGHGEGERPLPDLLVPLVYTNFDERVVTGSTDPFVLPVGFPYVTGAATYDANDGTNTTSEFSRCAGLEGEVVSVAASVDVDTVEAGFGVRLEDIPAERLVTAANSIAGAPLGSIPLGSIPLGSIPLGSIPLGSIGGTATTVLADVSIEGGWAPLLAGTSLAGLPLQTITLGEAFAVLQAEFPDRLIELKLAALDPSRSPFSELSLAALLLGDAELCGLLPDVQDCANQTVLSYEQGGGSVASLPLGSIPLGSIPLGSIPLGSIPLGSIPLGSIPLGSIPLGSIPLGSIGDLAAAPLGSIPLGSIPLGSIPLGSIPLGSIPLGSIPLGSIPLGRIDVGQPDFCDFHDAAVSASPSLSCASLGIDPATTTVIEYTELLDAAGDLAATPLGSIPLGSIPLGSIPLGSIELTESPLGSIPLGSIPLGSIELAASPLGRIPLGSIPLGSIDLDDVCSGVANCGPSMLLHEYVAAAGDLEATPLGSIDLSTLPLGSIPLGSIPLDTVEIAGFPLGSIPLGSIDLAQSPLGSILINGRPLRSIPAAELDQLGLTVGDLAATDLANHTLADVLDHLTLSFLALLGGLDGLTFGELLVAALVGADFPWEDLPLDEVETRDVACGPFLFDASWCEGTVGEPSTEGQRNPLAPDSVGVLVGIDVVGGPVRNLVVRLSSDGPLTTVPEVAYIEAGPSFASFNPRQDGDDVVVHIPFLAAGMHQLHVEVFPGLQAGTQGIFVAVEHGGGMLGSGTAVTVASATTGSSRENPTEIEPNALYVGYVGLPGEQDWYQVPAPPAGQRVSVFLSNLAGDVDTFIYRPDTAPPLSGAGTERQIPLGSTPVDDGGAGPGVDGALSPELLADTPIDESLSLVASSTNRATTAEQATFFSRSGESDYLIQVAGYNRATSASPYVLRVKYEPVVVEPVCPARGYEPLLASALPSVPQGTDTLFLTNPQRMDALYPGDAGSVGGALEELLDNTDVAGAVVDIAGIPGVADAFNAWDDDPCDPALANRVAGLVQGWIQETVEAVSSIRHVAIVGSDEVVPFARLQDSTVVANESTYVEELAGDSAIRGAHASRTYLSDAPYGDLDPVPWLDRYAYLPDLGVGRLVETPEHIVGALNAFVAEGGELDPQSAAIAGYDFLTDGARQTKANLTGVDDADPNEALINDEWSRQDLLDLAYGPTGPDGLPDVISPNAHFDHYRALPAIGNLNPDEAELFEVSDLGEVGTPSTDLTNRIVFTMGCHGGLNVPNRGAENETDWAEVYGAARAIYVGNTGYGYGDTATVALTERVMANFAFYLDGDRTVGQALAQAKQDQFGRAGLYGVYDLKSIEQATLYGLPMWQIAGPGRTPAPSPIGTPAEESITGLEAANFTLTPSFTQLDSPNGSFFEADGGTQFLHWRPIQPLTSIDVTQTGLVATGVLLTDLESRDIEVTDAAFGRPMTTSSLDRQPEVQTANTVFPSTFATLGTSSNLNTGSTGGPTNTHQHANIIPGQYIGTGTPPVQRLFDTVGGLVYYQSSGADIDWSPPMIHQADATTAGNVATFTVDTTDADSGVSRVVVVYRAAVAGGISEWRAIDLVPEGGQWVGTGTFESSVTPPLDYLVQAVNGDGVIGTSTFKGEFYRTDVDADPVDPSVTCNDGECLGDWADGPVTVEAPGAQISVDNGSFEDDTVTVDDDGLHTVIVRRDGVTIASFTVRIDQTPPEVEIAAPIDGGVFGRGEQVLADYACTDALELVSCTGSVALGAPIDTSSTGVRTFSVTAVDAAGNQTTVTVSYRVSGMGGLEPPIKAPPAVNTVRGGQTVPVKFQVFDANGRPVTKLSAITSIAYVKTDCAGNPKGTPVVLATPEKPNGLKVTGKRFHYNWKVPSSAGCYQLQVALADGTVHGADFKVTASGGGKKDDRDDDKRDRDRDRDDDKRDRDDDKRDRDDDKRDRDDDRRPRSGKGTRGLFRC